MKRKIFVVGSQYGYANWMVGDTVGKIEDADLVVFTGGEDVSPSFYHERAHPLTSSNPARDAYEYAAFLEARRLGKHLIGICRGSQLLCVMAHGRLVQHQGHPGPYHKMVTVDGANRGEIFVTSSHHQAQFPWGLPFEEYKILGFTNNICDYHEDGRGNEMVIGMADGGQDFPEVEVAYYPKIKALAIQSHPEWQYPPVSFDDRKAIDYFQKLLDAHMEDKL